MTEKESPFACDMTAIAPEERDAHLARIERIFRSVLLSLTGRDGVKPFIMTEIGDHLPREK